MRLVTVSYTGLHAGGGVPSFNRMLHGACADLDPIHFCWTDHPLHSESSAWSEWDRALELNRHLVDTGAISSDDLVVADGFWAAGLESIPNSVSVCHGIWSHLTVEDVAAGKAPDMPHHHEAQLAFRRSWMGAGRRTVAVSNFIADQMRLQWGLTVDAVIGNAVDLDLFRPPVSMLGRSRPVIVHGVNDRSNLNKGWDHIDLLQRSLDADVVSLDELSAGTGLSKPQALAQADLLVHPSGFEGHSVLLCEALACGVPIVCYDVGYAQDLRDARVGWVMDKRERSPERTLQGVREIYETFSRGHRQWFSSHARSVAELELGLDTFTRRWRGYLGLAHS